MRALGLYAQSLRRCRATFALGFKGVMKICILLCRVAFMACCVCVCVCVHALFNIIIESSAMAAVNYTFV